MVPSRLSWSLFTASLVLNVQYAALATVVVPALLARADEASKETALAVVMTLSSLVTLVVHPLVGAWSDRSRSRWGRRTPWIALGAVASAIAIAGLGQAATVVAVGLGWLLVQPLLNVVEAPLDAVLADRVPESGRPRVSAYYGAGAALGLAVGAMVAGVLINRISLLTTVLAGVLVVTMIGFVVVNRDRTEAPARASLSWRHAWGDRDFRLVFVARLALVLGNQLVLGYLLYVVMDRTGRDVDDAGSLVTVLVGVHILSIVVGAAIAARVVRGRRVPAVIAATVVVACGLALPIVVPGVAGIAAYAVVSGVGRGVYLTADLALMLDVLPSSADHGRDLGVLGLATILPQSVAPAVAGALLAATGNTYTALFVVALVLVLASIPVISRVQVGPATPREGAAMMDR
ncbi:MFS transporter [Nocardioides massiliensis]|uniref:MFS family permease n=1 Tax=Nocardioides massiliensis TaxID=1325935 RepID=A0ABT9NLR6_9ACTN|nr:MFS transporter [Nocardioides massiliensis]MDP9821366.1 MFS family permease [Nocardioides massiliensis]